VAKELNIPVIAVSQLSRRTEERTGMRPQLSDLRESGAIEQDADLILFLYRDEVYNRADDNPNRGKAEVIIGKQRNGPTGKIELAFLNKFTTFKDLYKGEVEG
jgi:replicative DNA helicase